MRKWIAWFACLLLGTSILASCASTPKAEDQSTGSSTEQSPAVDTEQGSEMEAE